MEEALDNLEDRPHPASPQQTAVCDDKREQPHTHAQRSLQQMQQQMANAQPSASCKTGN